MTDELWSAAYDSARVVRVNALRPFGFSERPGSFFGHGHGALG